MTRSTTLSSSRPSTLGRPLIDDEAIRAQFTSDFLAMLNARVLKVQTELHVANDMDAEIAMLSLQTSSSMVGATAMADIVKAMRAALKLQDRPALVELSDALVAEAKRLPAQLAPR